MKNNSAYTLVELLVGTSILSIVFGIGLVNYRDFSRRQALTKTVKQVKADIRSAQQFALIGQKPEGSCDNLDGYTFSRTSATNYRILVNCVSNLGLATSLEIKNVILDTGITFTSTNPSFKFKILGQGTNLLSSNTLTFTSSIAGTVETIVIGTRGDVK